MREGLAPSFGVPSGVQTGAQSGAADFHGLAPHSVALERSGISAPEPIANGLLAVSEQRKSGLILCREFYAEFAGPGAAVFTPVERPYTAVIAIGAPEITRVTEPRDRQRAYSRRIQWFRWLEKISDSANPAQRAEKLLYSFEAFFDSRVLISLPDQILALLVGVLPQTIALVRAQNRSMEQGSAAADSKTPGPGVCILNPYTLQPFESKGGSSFSAVTRPGSKVDDSSAATRASAVWAESVWSDPSLRVGVS
jgi:hypothetical protein